MSKEAQIVEALIESSTEYACGHVKYRREENQFRIWSSISTGNGSFYSTELVTKLSAFSSYCMYNSIEERVELIIITH